MHHRSIVLAILVAAALTATAFEKNELLTRLEAIAAKRLVEHNEVARRTFGIQQQTSAPTTAAPTTKAPTAPPISTSGGSSSPSSSTPRNSDLFPSNSPPQCGKHAPFGAALTYVNDACTRAFGVLNRVDVKNKSATLTAYGDFCTSPCLSALNQLMGDVDFRDCLAPNISKMLAPMLSFCDKDSKGQYCVLKFAEMAAQPPAPVDTCKSISNKSICVGTTNCSWNANSKACERAITKADMDLICDSCITGLAASSADLATLALVCTKIDGNYCALELMAFTLDNPDSQTLGRFCSSDAPFRLACVSQMLGVSVQSAVAGAQNTYLQCVKRSNANITDCVANYFNIVTSAQQGLSQIPTVCRKNPSGKICYDGAPATLADPCLGAVAIGVACSSGCATSIQNISNTLGCCLGFMNNLFVPVPYSIAQLPGAYATATHLPAARALINVKANLSLVGNCQGYTAPVPLSDTCTGAAVTATDVLSVNLKLVWKPIDNSSELKRDVIRSLVHDISACVGAHPSAMIDAAIAENTNIKIDTINSTGSTFTFKFKADTQDLTSAFKRAFDARNAAGDFVLLVLNSTLTSSCPRGCVGVQGTARAVVATAAKALALGSNVRKDPCYDKEFFGLVSRVLTSCDAVGNPFDAPYTTQEASNATFAATCRGPCVGGLRALAASKFAKCIPKDLALMSNMVAVACYVDQKTKFFCGSVIHRFQSTDCDSLPNSTVCNSKGQCKWNANKSRCDTRPSTEFLASICEGRCVPLYTASMAGDQGPLGTAARFIDQAVCAKENNTYCFPAVAEELNDELFSLATVKSLCGNGTKGRCFRRIQTALSATVIKTAEETFFDCAAGTGYDQDTVEANCLSGYFSTLTAAGKYDEIVRGMCLRKTGTDVLCLSFFEKYGSNTCITNAAKGTCSSQCTSTLSAAFTDMGCCAGTLQLTYGNPNKDYDLIPVFSAPGAHQTLSPRKTTAAPLPALDASFINLTVEEEVPVTEGFLTSAYKCLNDSSMKFIRRACKKVREGSAVQKELPIGIAFNAVKTDPKRQQRLQRASIADLANKLGLAKDDLVTFVIGENPSVKIKPATAPSRHGFEEQQTSVTTDDTTSSGSKLTFSIQAQTAEDTAAASASFDYLKANNQLNMPATTGTVGQECPTCVASGASASSVQSAATSTSLATQVNQTSSASARATLLTATIVTAVMALLLL